MCYKDMLANAIRYASLHQVFVRDLVGDASILHSLRVMFAVNSDFAKVVAVLHDVVEDCNISLEDIELIFGKDVADGVDLITRRDKESYQDYISRIYNSRETFAFWKEVNEVKIADIEDHIERLNDIEDEKTYERLAKKYYRALLYLKTGFYAGA